MYRCVHVGGEASLLVEECMFIHVAVIPRTHCFPWVGVFDVIGHLKLHTAADS